ncbi:MAG: hypothetical protein IT307_10260 [Chloroflexi bacterium]|nr:hypothetical protein [Chloroflexota bacterium]
MATAVEASSITYGRRTSRLQRLFSNRSLMLVLVFLLITVGWEAYGRISSQLRMSPAVQEALQTGQPVDVVLYLPFAPEQFHVKLLQKYGTVSGVSANAVTVRRVKPDDLKDLAKSYWISSIKLESEPQ